MYRILRIADQIIWGSKYRACIRDCPPTYLPARKYIHAIYRGECTGSARVPGSLDFSARGKAGQDKERHGGFLFPPPFTASPCVPYVGRYDTISRRAPGGRVGALSFGPLHPRPLSRVSSPFILQAGIPKTWEEGKGREMQCRFDGIVRSI